MKKLNCSTNQSGTSLVEIILYVGIISVLSVFLIYSVVGLTQNYKKIQLQSEVMKNTAAAFSLISEELRSARAIYEPTSVFGENPGQLSLKSLRGVPDGENFAYVDFYLDNQRIYLKRDGSESFPITSDRILVSRLEFARVGTGTTTPSVRIDLSASPNLPPGNHFYFVKNFSATAGLR